MGGVEGKLDEMLDGVHIMEREKNKNKITHAWKWFAIALVNINHANFSVCVA